MCEPLPELDMILRYPALDLDVALREVDPICWYKSGIHCTSYESKRMKSMVFIQNNTASAYQYPPIVAFILNRQETEHPHPPEYVQSVRCFTRHTIISIAWPKDVLR